MLEAVVFRRRERAESRSGFAVLREVSRPRDCGHDLGRKQFWAALDELSMYSLEIADTGMREPHWHPVTAELGHVQIVAAG